MKRGLLLLTTAALALALSGCGGKPAPETEPSPPPEAPLAWETLTVELSKEGQATQDLLSAVRELPAPLAAALANHGVTVERVEITVGSSHAATVQALEEGGVDLAFLPAEALAEGETAPQALLVSGPTFRDQGERAEDWNREPADTPAVPGSRTLLCAAPTEYGKNLAGRRDWSWEELSRARWGVLEGDSLPGYRAVNLYLADHYEGDTLADLPDVTAYADLSSLLGAAANGEIDLLAMDDAGRSDWAEAWTLAKTERDSRGEAGLGRSGAIWEELPVLALTERFYSGAAAVRPDSESLASERFAAALAAAVEDLTRDNAVGALAKEVLGAEPYIPAPGGALDPLRRLLTME
ncbi:PhnD/SsuA/transferrin family substrate-binding protein [Oscillibacter sp.]|uniref:PhnD/SsuA/transferrin family substrate-binding protein n=1 Tax=Oscillibacter sp. TaxID=1945593 RepID=UPI002634958A|nr:PhnD/SsuA/transferrin family substrate-binding protein [Oscillibacter sp.]MDD3346210.1 PhnD/SsuA/transferrin family substrate-binding protein [Oscillibacter sp.]